MLEACSLWYSIKWNNICSEQTHWLKTVYHLLNAYLTSYIVYLQELYLKTGECHHQTGRVVRLWPMTTCIYGYGGWPRDKESVRSNCKCILHGKKQRNRLYLLTELEPRSKIAWGKPGIHCHMQFALKVNELVIHTARACSVKMKNEKLGDNKLCS